MKNIIPVHKLFFSVFFILVAACGLSQKQFTVTSSKANNYCNGTCTLVDNPDLNGNPTAVLFITAVQVNRVNLDPHPITAYYNGKQWSIMNVDNSNMPTGAQFSIQYYTSPDDNHFVHVVTKENIVKNNSYIDHAGLNGNPQVKIQYFQSASPNVRGGYVNKSDIKIQYDEAVGKWYMTNSNGTTLDYATGYSISIPEVTVVATNNTNPVTTTPISTTSFTPGAKTDNSGQRIFLTVTGATQGLFTGENGTNRMELSGFDMEVLTAREAATGMATGRRQYTPTAFEKPSGANSVQFFKALVLNEVISSALIEVYEPSPNGSGASTLTYKIVLTNARVSGFKQSYVAGQKGLIDSIKMVFLSISCTYINGGVTYTDNWSTQN